MFSDLIYTWHARLYAELDGYTRVQFQSQVAPQVSHMLTEKLDKEVPLAVEMVLQNLVSHVDPKTDNLKLLDDFSVEWQQQPEWGLGRYKWPELFRSVNHMFGNPEFLMHGLGYLPIEITPITVESVPDGWNFRSSLFKTLSKELLNEEYRPDDLILHVRILPEYLFCHFLFTQHRTDVCHFGSLGMNFAEDEEDEWTQEEEDEWTLSIFGSHACRKLDGHFPVYFMDYERVKPLEVYGSVEDVMIVLSGESDPACC